MNHKTFDVLHFNNLKYMVVDVLELNGNIYYYLINDEDGQDDVALVKKVMQDEKEIFINIENEEEFNEVLKELVSRNKDLLDTLSGEEN